ncbi:hypothetical protein PYCCODRAFT_1375096, partial [Trametes coccinea BRFM310]
RISGLALLNLKARNEAVDLMWVKDYLRLDDTRPAWAVVADHLLARAAASEHKHVDPAVRTNTFMQTWKVSRRIATGLPADLRRMLKVAEKHEVRLFAPKPSAAVRNALPIWYHVGTKPGRYVANSIAGKCLRENHNVKTVAQAAQAARMEATDDDQHSGASTCRCRRCEWDRAHGCENPSRCVAAARKALQRL